VSGTVGIPLEAQAPSPLDALAKWGQVQQQGAQTGLIGQQATGQALNNQQLALMLGLRSALVGSILPGGGQGAPGAAPGGQPGAGPTGMPGVVQASAPGGATAVGPQVPPPMSAFGATMSPFGVPLPRSTYIAAMMQPNPMEGLTSAFNMGRQHIASVLTQAGNPDQVRAAAQQLYQEGWIGPDGYQALYSDPTKKQAFLDSTASPDTQMSRFTALTNLGVKMGPDGNVVLNPPVIAAKAAMGGAEKGFMPTPEGGLAPISGGPADPNYIGTAAAQKPFDLRQGGLHWDPVHGWVKNPQIIETTDANGNKVPMWASPPMPTTGQPGGAVPPDPFPGWAKRINSAENATGNPAATNPSSTATGNGQFIAGTWPGVIRAARPDLAAGQTDEQLNALRSNPELAAAATETYARQNAAALAAAGQVVAPETVSLAHALGPAGAITVLKADPRAPAAQVLPPAVLAANPQFRNMTAGQIVQWAGSRMGAEPPPANTGTAEPIVTPGGQQVITAAPPQQVEGREAAVKDFLTKDNDAYQAAQNTQAWIHQVTSAADTMNAAGPAYMTGPFAPQRLAAMSTVNDLARTANITPPFDQNALASWEEMKKATTTAGFELSSHYEGHARQAAQTIMNATSAVPAQTNSPVGVKLVAAGIQEGAQSAIDLHNYKQGIYNATQGAGLEHAENDFYQANPAAMYAARAISTVHPVQITDPAQFTKYLPGTYAMLPNGKLVQVPERPGAPPIPPYLQSQAHAAAATPTLPGGPTQQAANP